MTYLLKIFMIIFCIVIVTFSVVVKAYQSNDLYNLYKNSTSRSPYVIFTARKGVPGHAFVILGEELDNSLFWNNAVFGFYPKDGKKLFIRAIIGTPGRVDYKWEDLERDHEHRVPINEKTKNKILNVFHKWLNVEYTLFDKNCNQFISEIAEASGLIIPKANPGVTLPANYIKQLIEAQPHNVPAAPFIE